MNKRTFKIKEPVCGIRQVGCVCSSTNLEDLLDCVDGGGKQRLHLLVIIDVVSVADAHEEDVSWQTGHRTRHVVGADV